LCSIFGCHITNTEINRLFAENNKNPDIFSDPSIKNNTLTCKEIDIIKYLDRIGELSQRNDSGSFDALKQRQKELFNFICNFTNREGQGPHGRIDIKNDFNMNYKNQNNIQWDWDCRECSISDFCYNTVNKEDNPNKFLLKVDGQYQTVGFNWDTNGEQIMITWTIKCLRTFNVGSYNNGEFTWNFNELESELNNIIT